MPYFDSFFIPWHFSDGEVLERPPPINAVYYSEQSNCYWCRQCDHHICLVWLQSISPNSSRHWGQHRMGGQAAVLSEGYAHWCDSRDRYCQVVAGTYVIFISVASQVSLCLLIGKSQTLSHPQMHRPWYPSHSCLFCPMRAALFGSEGNCRWLLCTSGTEEVQGASNHEICMV